MKEFWKWAKFRYIPNIFAKQNLWLEHIYLTPVKTQLLRYNLP